MRPDILAAYPAVAPDRVHVIRNGIDTAQYAPDPDTDVLERYGIDPGRPVGGLRRAGDPAEGPAGAAAGRRAARPGGPAGAVRRAGRHPRAGRRGGGPGRAPAADPARRDLDPGHAGQARGHPDPQPRDRVRLPVAVRAARASSTWRPWPAAPRSSARGSAASPRWWRPGRPACWSRRTTRRPWPARSTPWSTTRAGRPRWAGPAGTGPWPSSAGRRSPRRPRSCTRPWPSPALAAPPAIRRRIPSIHLNFAGGPRRHHAAFQPARAALEPTRPGRSGSSDRDRDATAQVLQAAFAEGRLDDDEFDQRMRAALTARVSTDLEKLTADLPAGGPRPAGPPAAAGGRRPASTPWPTRAPSGAAAAGGCPSASARSSTRAAAGSTCGPPS